MAERVSMIEEIVDGVPVIMTEFGYKTFSMVVKSIGTFTNRISPTYLSTSGVMETWHGQPKVSPDYPQPSTDYIQQLYRDANASYDTLVFGPGVEICNYIAAALGAPVLPTQFIASAPDLSFVEKNANPKQTYVVGHEMDWPELCIWIKPQHLGELYSEMIEKAENVLIFSTDSGPQCHRGTNRGWAKDNIHVLEKFTAGDEYASRIGDPDQRGYESPHDKIAHWEFAMQHDQILNLEQYCLERGKRTAMISSGDWMSFLPMVAYKTLFEKNGFQPTGLTFHSYWSCHPFYEREFLRIPVIDFQYGADEFVDEYKKVIDDIDWINKDAEYIIWAPELNHTNSVDPQKRFESWGFPTVYKNERPYDIWRYFWDDFHDPHCPTREYLVPKMKGKNHFKEFDFLTFDEVVRISQGVRKTNVTVNRP